MTIKPFKALSRTSIVLTVGAALILSTVSVSNAETKYLDGPKGNMLGGYSGCGKDGFPSDSPTSSCGPGDPPLQKPCKSIWGGCGTDVEEERPTGGRPSKPALNGGGTMVMPPDTNTTVGSAVNPLNGKLIMRNVIRN